MSKKKFTPGPWKTDFNNPFATIEGHIIKQDDDVERPIASIPKGGGTNGIQSQEANARLMTAAPELLEALEETVALLENHLPGHLLDKQMAAIKKAIGEKDG
jgi:hypothetical protein